MRYTASRIAALFACFLYDIYERIIDIINVDIRRLQTTILKDTIARPMGPGMPRRIAIVAIYPSANSLPFTVNLLSGLARNGFHTVVVSTRMVDEPDRARILEHADRLIERPPVGRDFGSYQVGLRLSGLLDGASASGCEHLLLVNDSMFYRTDTGDLIAELLRLPHDFQTLFENFENSYHAQSFFLLIGREAFLGAAFRGFWQRYRPYSSRHYAIEAGEVGLTRSLRKGGIDVVAYYNSSRIRQALDDLITTGKRDELLDLLPVHSDINFMTVSDNLSRAMLSDRADTPAARSWRDGLARAEANEQPIGLRDNPLFWWRLARQIELVAETRNPTHFLGLIMNRYVRAPLKRDVCYRGTFGIAQVIATATGFEPDQYHALAADLRSKGLPSSLRGIRWLLYSRGRI